MADSSQNSWQDSSNAPKIPPSVNLGEKAYFIGIFSCAASYGIVIVLFFRCIGALLNPDSRTRGGLKWLLVGHTVSLFLFVTVFTGINLDVLSISYIDNRASPGTSELLPGPLGYQSSTYSMKIGVVSTAMFLFNNWLADGLLLYRCYVIYALNSWAIIFPSLLYLATFATGIVLIYYQASQPGCTFWRSTTINVGVPYSISVSLNILLTLMIIGRLVLLSRAVRSAMNAPFKISGMYKAIISIVCESSAIYAITFLLWIGTWAADSPFEYFFFPTLAQTQVIAPFLIVLRVADRRSVSDIVSGDVDTIHFSQEASTSSGRTPSGGRSMGFAGRGEKNPAELGVKTVTTIDLHRDKV